MGCLKRQKKTDKQLIINTMTNLDEHYQQLIKQSFDVFKKQLEVMQKELLTANKTPVEIATQIMNIEEIKQKLTNVEMDLDELPF